MSTIEVIRRIPEWFEYRAPRLFAWGADVQVRGSN
mgnify:CR=1 FL=1